jgi:hypothetical protein
MHPAKTHRDFSKSSLRDSQREASATAKVFGRCKTDDARSAGDRSARPPAANETMHHG